MLRCISDGQASCWPASLNVPPSVGPLRHLSSVSILSSHVEGTELYYLVPLPLSPPFLSLLNQLSVVTVPLSTEDDYKYA